MADLKRVGQIKAGDTITLTHRGYTEKHKVKEVLFAGDENEEILLYVMKNLYFITSMAIDGSSWAKNVKFN